jgi:hypothetical protein
MIIGDMTPDRYVTICIGSQNATANIKGTARIHEGPGAISFISVTWHFF